MILTFEDYGTMYRSLEWDEFRTIHAEMARETEQAELEDWYDEFVQRCRAYVVYRQEWLFMTRKEASDMDDERTAFHNNVIASLKGLEHALKERGYPAGWADRLDITSRKRVGDFACYIMFLHGIMAR